MAKAQHVIVIEGVNGAGKTRYARHLSLATDFPVYRAFRGSEDEHYTEGEGKARLEKLEGLGIPVNSYVEDMFAADMLVRLKASAILDRSLPSAIVYGNPLRRATGGSDLELTASLNQARWELWESLMIRAGGILVHLAVSYDAAKARANGRTIPTRSEHRALERAYEKLLKRAKLPVIVIDTDAVQCEHGVRRIMKAIA
jgi:thymidylate kinase